MFGINLPQGGELIIILFIALILFGAKKLPDIGKGLGKGIREFKTATKGLGDDVKSGMDEDAPTEGGTSKSE